MKVLLTKKKTPPPFSMSNFRSLDCSFPGFAGLPHSGYDDENV